jgi:type III restriction enzyme
MKLKFKRQAYQSRAVKAVIDCFCGQPNLAGVKYRIDPGIKRKSREGDSPVNLFKSSGLKNDDAELRNSPDGLSLKF